MFNQQLFICDWWHNVQCDQVTTHYELNANIYDYNWESKRTNKNPKRSTTSQSDAGELLKRDGNLKSSNDTEFPFSITTTISPILDSTDNVDDAITTTENTNALFTETVFGSRGSKAKSDSSEETDQKKKRNNLSVSGVKGGKLVKFNRINSLASSSKSPKSSTSSGTTSSFFSRYKYASHQQLQNHTPKPSLKNQFQTNPAISSLRSSTSSRSSPSSSHSSSHPSSHLPFTSHLSSSSLNSHRSKHYRA